MWWATVDVLPKGACWQSKEERNLCRRLRSCMRCVESKSASRHFLKTSSDRRTSVVWGEVRAFSGREGGTSETLKPRIREVGSIWPIDSPWNRQTGWSVWLGTIMVVCPDRRVRRANGRGKFFRRTKRSDGVNRTGPSGMVVQERGTNTELRGRISTSSERTSFESPTQELSNGGTSMSEKSSSSALAQSITASWHERKSHPRMTSCEHEDKTTNSIG